MLCIKIRLWMRRWIPKIVCAIVYKHFGRAPPRLAHADISWSLTNSYYCHLRVATTAQSNTLLVYIFACRGCFLFRRLRFFSFRRSKNSFRGMAAVQAQRRGDAALTGPYTLRTLLDHVPLSAEGESADTVITCVEYWGL